MGYKEVGIRGKTIGGHRSRGSLMGFYDVRASINITIPKEYATRGNPGELLPYV